MSTPFCPRDLSLPNLVLNLSTTKQQKTREQNVSSECKNEMYSSLFVCPRQVTQELKRTTEVVKANT